MCINHLFFTHLSVDMEIAIHKLAHNSVVNMGIQISLQVPVSVILDKYLEVGLRDRTTVLFLIWKGTSAATVSFCNHVNIVQTFQFLSTCYQHMLFSVVVVVVFL